MFHAHLSYQTLSAHSLCVLVFFLFCSPNLHLERLHDMCKNMSFKKCWHYNNLGFSILQVLSLIQGMESHTMSLSMKVMLFPMLLCVWIWLAGI